MINKRYILIGLILMSLIVVTANLSVDSVRSTDNLTLTTEDRNKLTELGVTTYDYKDVEVKGTVERRLKARGDYNLGSPLVVNKIKFINCTKYIINGLEKECVESEPIYYTDAEIQDLLKEEEEEWAEKIAKVERRRASERSVSVGVRN